MVVTAPARTGVVDVTVGSPGETALTAPRKFRYIGSPRAQDRYPQRPRQSSSKPLCTSSERKGVEPGRPIYGQ